MKFIPIVIHCLTNIIIQLSFFIHIVFFYDYTIKHIAILVVIGFSLILFDYRSCTHIFGRKPQPTWIAHFIDLILVIPNIALLGYSLLIDIANRDVVYPTYSYYEIVLTLSVVLVDISLIIERVQLIKTSQSNK